MYDERGALEDGADTDHIPVAELSDEEDVPRARRRSTAPRSRRVAALSLAVSLLLAAAVTASRLSFDTSIAVTSSTGSRGAPASTVPGQVDTQPANFSLPGDSDDRKRHPATFTFDPPEDRRGAALSAVAARFPHILLCTCCEEVMSQVIGVALVVRHRSQAICPTVNQRQVMYLRYMLHVHLHRVPSGECPRSLLRRRPAIRATTQRPRRRSAPAHGPQPVDCVLPDHPGHPAGHRARGLTLRGGDRDVHRGERGVVHRKLAAGMRVSWSTSTAGRCVQTYFLLLTDKYPPFTPLAGTDVRRVALTVPASGRVVTDDVDDAVTGAQRVDLGVETAFGLADQAANLPYGSTITIIARHQSSPP